jgi:hypothetical protein
MKLMCMQEVNKNETNKIVQTRFFGREWDSMQVES